MTKKSGGGDVVVDVVKEDGPPRTISEDIAADLADIEQSRDVDGMLLSHRLKESLLLPDKDDDDDDDDDEEGEVAMDTINVNSTTEEGDMTTLVDDGTLSQSENRDMLIPISASSDSADDEGAILPATTPHTGSSNSGLPPDNDEEENMLLLDEIRKDVIRTHPDLRFFLEPEEGLGQKRYAALERILFVWAKLNKGVSTIPMNKCIRVCVWSFLILCSTRYRFLLRYIGPICPRDE
jgi:hypothetical protein